MDVRAVDTSGLAAKRLEQLDKTRPVTEKANTEMYERFKARAADDASEREKHPRSPEEAQEDEPETLEDEYKEESTEQDVEQTHPDDDQGTNNGDYHILDVRV